MQNLQTNKVLQNVSENDSRFLTMAFPEDKLNCVNKASL